MAKLPQISGKELTKALKRDRWIEVSQKGSHLKLVKNYKIGKSTIIIPQHKVIKKGTLRRILRDAKLSVEQLAELL